MAEARAVRTRKIHHRGRTSQIGIYLGKQLRFFINENDWKVLPMAAIIAALVGMVIRKRFFINMEGSLIGAFALTCVAIWNGGFNSIQSVCRERAIIKREHRSGMHISSYVAAHMIYQFLLCAAQTGLTMYVLTILGVRFPAEGFMTPFMVLDIGITMLLITYASDMLSLFLSSISRTTTGAMTLMPFVLIFQLVFSGGIIPLPEWSQSLSDFTISNYGIRALAAQSGYNEMPMVTAWNTLEDMKDREVGGTVTVGQVLDFLNSPSVEKYREREVLPAMNVDELITDLAGDLGINGNLALLAAPALSDGGAGLPVTKEEPEEPVMTAPVSLGQVIDLLNGSSLVQSRRDREITLTAKLGDLMELVGEENLKARIQEATAEASYKEEYEKTPENVMTNWFMLAVFIFLFAGLSVLVLEMIDKDKR